MGKYKILVVTGDSLLAGSTNLVQLWLVGEHGEADLGKQLRPLRGRVSAGHWVGSQRPGDLGLCKGPGDCGEGRKPDPRELLRRWSGHDSRRRLTDWEERGQGKEWERGAGQKEGRG